MTGDGDGERIGGAGLGDRADRFGRADLLSDLGVAGRAAGLDVAERGPDPLLEGRAPHVERQVEAGGGLLHQGHDPGHGRIELWITAHQLGAGEAVLQVADQHVWIVAHQDGADPLWRRRRQDGAQGALADGEADHRVLAALAGLRWGHAQHLG